jgi:copper resistance protein B
LTARFEGTVDERITASRFAAARRNRPSAQDMPAQRLGGLTSAELGLRLRYEITRKFALCRRVLDLGKWANR